MILELWLKSDHNSKITWASCGGPGVLGGGVGS